MGGIVVTSLPSGDSVAQSVGIDREGRIVISGDVGSTNELAVSRYLPGGTLDSSFGSNGFATTKVGEGQNVGNGLAFDDAGRILMTGMHREAIGEGDLIVVRFEGSLPPTTTTTATSTTTTTTPVDDAFVDDDGSVFEGDIDAVAAAGITRGCNPPANDRYCPDDLVTRGQMAAFLNRAFLD